MRSTKTARRAIGPLALLILPMWALATFAAERGATECLPPGVGTFVFTGEPACDAISGCSEVVSGDHIVYRVHEGLANRDLNDDGDWDDNSVVVHRIGTGETRIVAPGWPRQVRGDLVAINTWEWVEGRDFNGDGDLLDGVVRWHRLSTGETSPLRMGHSPTVSDPWFAYVIPEAWIGEDRDGDGRLDDAVVELVDTRTGEAQSGRAVGFAPQFGARAVVFYTWERERDGAGRDLNGDGDLYDRVLRWWTLPDAEGLEPGVHATDAEAPPFYSLATIVEGDRVLLRSQGHVLSLEIGRPGFTDHGELELYRFQLDDERMVWAPARQDHFVLHDFRTGTDTRLPVGGDLRRFEGPWIHYVVPVDLHTYRPPRVFDLRSFSDREVGFQSLLSRYSTEMSHGLVTWSVKWLDNPSPCYPWEAPWLEYARPEAGDAYALHEPAPGLNPGSRSDRLIAFVHHEVAAGKNLDDDRGLAPGAPLTGGASLSYYVFPCESFDDLDRHIRAAAADDPLAIERLLEWSA